VLPGQKLPRRFCSTAYSAAAAVDATVPGSNVSVPAPAASDAACALLQPPVRKGHMAARKRAMRPDIELLLGP
jgi:hypothetical protein